MLDTVEALLEAVDKTQLDAKDVDVSVCSAGIPKFKWVLMPSCSSSLYRIVLLQDCSALGLAVCGGHVDVAQCLLLAGANVNVIAYKVQVRQLLSLAFIQLCATVLLPRA